MAQQAPWEMDWGQGPSAPSGAVYGPAPKPDKPPEPKTSYRILTPNEAADRGLEQGTYQISSEGHVSEIRGGSSLTATQRGNINTKLQGLRQIEGQLSRMGEAEDNLQKEGWGGPVWGNLPGTGWDAESSVYDKAQSSLTAMIRTLTRTPGEGAMSDYESRLAAAIPPSRSDTREARAEATAGIKDLIRNLKGGYSELLGTTQSGQNKAPSGGSKRLRYNPKTGELE